MEQIELIQHWNYFCSLAERLDDTKHYIDHGLQEHNGKRELVHGKVYSDVFKQIIVLSASEFEIMSKALCHKKGVKNILALRGDVNPDFAIEKDFKYASDLTEYIMSKNRGFNVSGACYPEVHQEAANMIEDIQNLKKKVDSGADHLISQLFFDDQVFFDFQEKARIAGINVPIEAGIMPVTNKKQIERMVSMCGASIPAKLSKVLQRFGDNHEAMRDAGISYAIDQIIELAAHGVDGVHIYTMNDPYVARRISEGVKNILKSGK